MHSKSGNLQSIWIVSPPLIESPSIIIFAFPSSRGDPPFSTSSFFVTDSSLNLSSEVGFASSCNPISQPYTSSVFLDSVSALPKPSSILPDSGTVLPKSGPIFLVTNLFYPESVFLCLVVALNYLAPAFLCFSMHTCVQPN
jgi:hypothetical protein